MTRLKVHILGENNTSQADIAERTHLPLRSVQRILAETSPSQLELAGGQRAGAPPLGRPSKAGKELLERIRLVLLEEPNINAMEVLRRAKDWGYTGGRSQMSELVRQLRPKPNREPVVRFEGLPGEYTQFDFGEVQIEFPDGKRRIQFFAGRLKYSRYMSVVIVPDQTSETLARALLCCLSAFGGSSKEWVFDNPKTIRISPPGAPVVLHRHLAQLVAEYRVIPTLCAPRSGNQKGSVERLVGFVKNSFFRQRRFLGQADLESRLQEWLQEVNHQRPSDATGRIPEELRIEESVHLSKRPLQVAAEKWAIAATATVTPMGSVSVLGTFYMATARKMGATATVLIRQKTIEIILGEERSTHLREDHTGEVRRLPEQRDQVLKVLHGRRKRATFQRQCLLELGKPAFQFLEALVHQNDCWEEPCIQLYELLRQHDDEAMRGALDHCVANSSFTVMAVQVALEAA